MKRMFFLTAFCLVLGAGYVAAQDNTQDEDVRGSFLSSRPVAGGSVSVGASSTSSSGRRPRPASSGRRTTKPAPKASTSNQAAPATTVAKTLSETKLAPLAVGYTLYMRDANGDAVRVDPARAFRAGDRIRVALESNSSGYLYIFHTENGANPQMIFPDARLNAGDSFVEAHVPYEIPSRSASDERLRWFVFDENPATERLYIVLTREPLPGVPIENELVTYCAQSSNRCPWRPSTETFDTVQGGLTARVVVDKSDTYGQTESKAEIEATTRGLGLDQSAPAPSVIRMSASSDSNVLITVLDLTHK